MKNLLIALASALLLAVAVSELSQRIWPGSHLAVLFLSFIALLVNGLFNTRLARRLEPTQVAEAAAAPSAANGPGRQRNPAPARGRNSSREANLDPAREPRQDGRQGSARESRVGDSARGQRPERSASGSSKSASAASIPDGPREQGIVKWFNRSKGFGFVVRPNGEEIFVHQRSIRSEEGKGRPVLKDGETVSFVVAHRERGAQAEDVVPVNAE